MKVKWEISLFIGILLILAGGWIWAGFILSGLQGLACGFADKCNLPASHLNVPLLYFGSISPIVGLGFLILGIIDIIKQKKAKNLPNPTLTQK